MLGSPLKPIEEERLKTIMRNNARLQELGIKSLASLIASPTVFSPKKIKKEDSDSGSDYDPEGESDTSEADVSCQSSASEDNKLQVISLSRVYIHLCLVCMRKSKTSYIMIRREYMLVIC